MLQNQADQLLSAGGAGRGGVAGAQLGHEGALALHAADQALLLEHVHGALDGNFAHGIGFGQIVLRRQAVALGQRAGLDLVFQRLIDFAIEEFFVSHDGVSR